MPEKGTRWEGPLCCTLLLDQYKKLYLECEQASGVRGSSSGVTIKRSARR